MMNILRPLLLPALLWWPLHTPAGNNKGTLTITLYAYCGEEFGAPLASDALQWQGQLPCTDRYTIDVAPSAHAMQQPRMQRYALTLTIR